VTKIPFDGNFKENVLEESKRLEYIDTQIMYESNRKITEILTSTSLLNRKCFVIAGGPSLEGKFDFNLIKDQFTIGMNKTYMYYPTNILFLWDNDFYMNIIEKYYDKKENLPYFNNFINFKGIKICLALPARVNYGYGTYVILRRYRERVYYDIKEGIFSGNNSAFASTMLAISCGAKDIYLIGVDCKVSNEKIHWHSGYQWTKEDFSERCKVFKQEWEYWATKFKQQQINITQLYMDSPAETSLDCFPKKRYAEFISK
jgi:hypothetical protein